MEPAIKETLEQVSDATLEQPVTITVDVIPQYWLEQKLQQWGLLPKKRVFTLRPIYLGTLIKISKILLSLDLKLPETDAGNSGGKLLEANYQAIEKHGESLAIIVAYAIRNTNRRVDRRLVRFILQNFTSKELMGVLSLVLKQMNLTSFMTSIISVRGLNVLESPKAAPVPNANGNEVSL